MGLLAVRNFLKYMQANQRGRSWHRHRREAEWHDLNSVSDSIFKGRRKETNGRVRDGPSEDPLYVVLDSSCQKRHKSTL